MSQTRRHSNFASDTPFEIRKEILDYQATQSMSDTERAAYFGLPEGCRMRERAKIISPENLTIGKNCWIGEGAILDASGTLEIGSNTSIGLGVYLWTHDSHKLNIRGENTRDQSHRIRRSPTRVGSNCFIAGPSVVMPGVTISDKCIVAPMSVVYSDLPEKTTYKPYRQMYDLLKENEALACRVSSLESTCDRLSKEVDRLAVGRIPGPGR